MQIRELLDFGIVNVDKLAGPSSHQVAEYTRNILNVNKSGHPGTLDPNVTGCLPVALGKATKIIELLMGNSKEYVCVMELHKSVDEKDLRKAILSFKGKIKQTPPVKSAVKRQERTREVYEIEILQIEDREVLFRVSCEAGTYIRVLCHQIGQKLGCGAHMKELRRIRSGIFDESSLVTLNDLRDAYEMWNEGIKNKNQEKIKKGEELLCKYIYPIEHTAKYMTKVYANQSGFKLVNNGQNLKEYNIYKIEKPDNNFQNSKGEKIAIFYKNKLVGLGNLIINPRLFKNEGNKLAVQVYKVFERKF